MVLKMVFKIKKLFFRRLNVISYSQMKSLRFIFFSYD